MDNSSDTAVRALCGSLFDGRASVEQATHHPIDRSLKIAPHRHPWMLQFDLMVRCGGRATQAAAATDLRRCTMMTTYPGQTHGYELRPDRDDAHVFHLKLAVRRHRGLNAPGPFPAMLTDQPEPAALHRAFEEVTRLSETQPQDGTLFLAAVARVVALWPTSESVTSAGTQLVSEAILSGTRPDERLPMGEVLELIDRRLDDPPALSELAAMSHVSTRHFARRFKATMGCTPLAYVNGRRLRAAKRLLAEQDRAIRDVGRAMGFPSPPAFTRWFKQQVGQTPQAYRDDPTRM